MKTPDNEKTPKIKLDDANYNNNPTINDIKDASLKENFKKIKIAILSSYTIQNTRQTLELELIKNEFDAQITYGQYNQYMQELLDENSFVYKLMPDIIIIALDTKTFLDNLQFKCTDIGKKELEEITSTKIEYIRNILNRASEKTNAKIILTNLEVPTYSPHGIMDANIFEGYRYFVSNLNYRLFETAKQAKNCVILDFEKLASYVGKNNLIEPKYYYAGKLYLGNKINKLFCEEITKIISATYGKSKKCIILDLDNTIWGGIVGEDGPNGIKIGDEGIGGAYKDAQKIILNLYKRGILLAINSKNNPADVFLAFEQNKNMILKKEHFASIKINWQNKPDNIIQIANELNIGLNSIVFIDDNPAERGLVKSVLPQVSVPDFPIDASELPKMLEELGNFEFLEITQEDKKRNEMYLQENKRNEYKKNFENPADYLFDLKIEIQIEKNCKADLDRITQLINKTNQFNLCTNRYSKEQVSEYLCSQNHSTFSMRAKDKFGEFGLTGVCIFKETPQQIEITDFLVSCRILGRDIEKELIRYAINQFAFAKTKKIIARYRPTEKNVAAKDFYEQVNFIKESENQTGEKIYKYDNSKEVQKIPWILVKNEQ